jgi:hypothetical protein
MNSCFELEHGADWLKRREVIGIFLIGLVIIGYFIARTGMGTVSMIVVGPLLLAFVSMIFISPRNGIISLLIINFFILGVGRYARVDVPWGLGVDFMFLLIYLSLFFQSFHKDVNWSLAKNELTLIGVIWYAYALFELVNPQAGSRVAWFYAMRGISLYMLLTFPLIFILFNRHKDLNLFLLIWGLLSILGSLKGIQQKLLGVDPFEQLWLDEGGAAQHILFGKLRIFSFYSDAGQFGAAQGHAGIVFGILASFEKRTRLKIFYIIVSVLGIYGMMISGTRGALAVPIAGLGLYIMLKKNLKAMIVGGIALVAIFIFFKYTTIGQGNDTIRRMRTAFDPNDASLQVRLENQQKLKAYLAYYPFGGGLGSNGPIGMKYNPGTFLATIPSDSWYVNLWMQLGVVGLSLHILILVYILGKTSYTIVFKTRNDWIKNQQMALACGLFGIAIASYGNGVLGQMPTGILIYSSMAFMFLSKSYEKELDLSFPNTVLDK